MHVARTAPHDPDQRPSTEDRAARPAEGPTPAQRRPGPPGAKTTPRRAACSRGAITWYKNCGFVIEGKKRETAFLDGGWQSELVMGILKTEWRLLRATLLPDPDTSFGPRPIPIVYNLGVIGSGSTGMPRTTRLAGLPQRAGSRWSSHTRWAPNPIRGGGSFGHAEPGKPGRAVGNTGLRHSVSSRPPPAGRG